MTTRRRYWLRRKWLFAIGNMETAQEHLLEARAYYGTSNPKHTELVDLNLALLEQAKQFLIASRGKV